MKTKTNCSLTLHIMHTGRTKIEKLKFTWYEFAMGGILLQTFCDAQHTCIPYRELNLTYEEFEFLKERRMVVREPNRYLERNRHCCCINPMYIDIHDQTTEIEISLEEIKAEEYPKNDPDCKKYHKRATYIVSSQDAMCCVENLLIINT